MNKFKIGLLVAIVTLLFTACLKPKHSVRVTNNYAVALKIVIGPNDYGSVAPNSSTEYKSIPEGSHTMSGDVSGTLSVTGKGKHKWTVTISSSGGATIAEDK